MNTNELLHGERVSGFTLLPGQFQKGPISSPRVWENVPQGPGPLLLQLCPIRKPSPIFLTRRQRTEESFLAPTPKRKRMEEREREKAIFKGPLCLHARKDIKATGAWIPDLSREDPRQRGPTPFHLSHRVVFSTIA